MKFLHTSDWHLGHQLHGFSRDYEHRCFLNWLLDTLDTQQADALIVSGDIYDHANPSSAAQRLLFQFLSQVLQRRPPHFQTVIVGGNHDSAIRLDAPSPLLDPMRIHVVGGLPKRRADMDLDRLCVSLKNSRGEEVAWCAAMPYLRLADLPPLHHEDPDFDFLIEGVRQRYQELFDHVRAKSRPGQAIITTGHCYMAAGETSEFSERRILGGNQHALPADIFPEWLTYGALGHLHKAQRVASRDALRYCGSPIPLSFGERDYAHQVLAVTLEADQLQQVQVIQVPRAIEMVRLEALPIDELESRLNKLAPLEAKHQAHDRPYLEVNVKLTKPEPGLRRRIEAALEGKAPRLAKISLSYQGNILAEEATTLTLEDLTPYEVFENCYQRSYPGKPSQDLCNAFSALLELVEASP